MAFRRYLEIDLTTGLAFHEPDPLTQFVTAPPPTEVIFCDCLGVGRLCHHTYADGTEVTVEGATFMREPKEDFLARHKACTPRRQIFVEVTTRPTAQIGQRYDEATDTFSAVPAAPRTTVSKTALLTLLGPDLVAAWFASADPILVYGRELFKADTSVDLDSTAIAQVLTQAAALSLLKPEQAQAISTALTVK